MTKVTSMKFKNGPVEYFGRNKFGFCAGIHLFSTDVKIAINPVNSRHNVTDSCMIEIPKKDIPEFIKLLKEMI
jgi:hypothetical protein